MFDSTGLRVLCRQECLALLGRAAVGRVVYTEKAMPAIQPVSFALLRNLVVLRTEIGGTLSAAIRDSVVAFEADVVDRDLRRGWSVCVLGHADELRAPTDIEAARALGVRLWAPAREDRFVGIKMEIVTGRALPEPSAYSSLESVGTAARADSSATLGTGRETGRGDAVP